MPAVLLQGSSAGPRTGLEFTQVQCDLVAAQRLSGWPCVQELAREGTAVLQAILRPDNSLRFLKPGRLVTLRTPAGGRAWGVGIVVAVSRLPGSGGGSSGQKGSVLSALDPTAPYVVDTLLECQPGLPPAGGPPSPPPRNACAFAALGSLQASHPGHQAAHCSVHLASHSH